VAVSAFVDFLHGCKRHLHGDGEEPEAVIAIRTLCMDAVKAANSGHPATPMALAAVMYTV
jgi:transketolase